MGKWESSLHLTLVNVDHYRSLQEPCDPSKKKKKMNFFCEPIPVMDPIVIDIIKFDYETNSLFDFDYKSYK